MAAIIVDNSVQLDLKSRSQLKENFSCLVVGVTAGETVLVTSLVPIPTAQGSWPDDTSALSVARKLRRRLIGNSFILGLLCSSPDDIKQQVSQFQTVVSSLRSMLESNGKFIEHFYNRNYQAEKCNLLAIHNQSKNALSCRVFPDWRTAEHSSCDLGSRGSWIKAYCRLCLNTNAVSCVSLEDIESTTTVQKILGGILVSIFGDVSKKNVRFIVKGKNILINGADSTALSSVIQDGAVEVEMLCQPFVRQEENIYTEEAEYFRMAVGGDIEAAVCLHSKYSTQADLYNGLLSDIIFSLADLFTSSLKSFRKEMEQSNEEYSLLSLPKRLLPEVVLPGSDKADMLNWSLATYEVDQSSELEFIFHRDQVMNELTAKTRETGKAADRGANKRAARDEGVSLDNLSCSSSYGAAMFFLGGFVLVILAIFIQSFIPSLDHYE